MRTSPTQYNIETESQSELITREDSERGVLFLDYWELTKPRLSLLAVISAIVGYLVAQPEKDILLFMNLLIGTSLAAGGAAVLNHWQERETDAIMVRTRNRPIPSGSISPKAAFIYGIVITITGDLLLWLGVNSLAASLALITQAADLLVYTPLKQRSHWCTEIGAIPGAIPPLIGWAAAEGSISTLGWILFAILLTWQIPHFMAIAWKFRKDYEKAGFPMLSVIDVSGARVARQSLIFTLLLIISSLTPTILGYTSLFYALVAAGLGTWFLIMALCFMQAANRDKTAHKLFMVSIAYLPLLLAALVIDRWFIV